MMRIPATLVSIAFLATCVAPSQGGGAFDDDATSENSIDKAGGLFDDAPVLALGTPALGSVEPGELNIYVIDLKKGQQIRLKQTRKSGDLRPHFTLYTPQLGKVGSSSYSRTASTLTKNYTVAATGRFYVGVAPYQGQGKGKYAIAATCTGNCSGDVEPLTPIEQNACLAQARACTLTNLLATSGAISATAAKAAYAACAAEAGCAQVCQIDQEHQALCDSVALDMAYYARTSASCRETFTDCISECTTYDGVSAEALMELSESMCLLNGYNGTCDGYARDHETCGGTLEADSTAACEGLCAAVFGAWNDDLDTYCEERCED